MAYADAIKAAIPRPLGTVEEVSDHLGVPINTLYQWRRKGVGPKASRVGRHLRYKWSDVDAWLESQASGGTAA
jgi:excisionase family DNA binding protein